MRQITEEFRTAEFVISVLQPEPLGEPILTLNESLTMGEGRHATVNVSVVNVSDKPVKSLRINKIEINNRPTKIISATEPQTLQPGEHAGLKASIEILDRDTFHYNLDTGRPTIEQVRRDIKHTLFTRNKEALALAMGFWRTSIETVDMTRLHTLNADQKRVRDSYDTYSLVQKRTNMPSRSWSYNALSESRQTINEDDTLGEDFDEFSP